MASAAVTSGGREVRRMDVVRAIGRGGSSGVEASLEAVSGIVGVGVLEVGGVDIAVEALLGRVECWIKGGNNFESKQEIWEP